MTTPVAIIHSVGRVELRALRDYEPYIRVYTLKRPAYVDDYKPADPYAILDLDLITLKAHRVVGFPNITCAYWADTWLDDWALDELYQHFYGKPRPRESYCDFRVAKDLERR